MLTLTRKLLHQVAVYFSKTSNPNAQSLIHTITWNRCSLVWALSIHLTLIVSCNTPEVVPTQGPGAEEHTLQSDSVTQLRTKAQDPDFMEPMQADGAFGGLEGFVRDVGGNPIGMATIQIDGLNLGSATAPNGHYFLSRIPPDVHTLVIKAPGLSQDLSVRVLPDSVLQLDITLE